MSLRKLIFTLAATAALDSISGDEKKQVYKVLELLKYPVSTRPKKLTVFRSRLEPKRYIVRVTSSLRIVYHRVSARELLIDDVYRKGAVDGLLKNRKSK